jgi:DNA-binding transcriptional LysR family regulator
MSQPAVSNALRRARKLTQDQLFLKVADGVQPTARMLAIWPELHRSLAVIRASPYAQSRSRSTPMPARWAGSNAAHWIALSACFRRFLVSSMSRAFARITTCA